MTAVYILLALVLIFCLCGAIFYRLALRRKGPRHSTPKGLEPVCPSESREWFESHVTGETELRARDGLKLHGYLLLQGDGRKFVIACHGYSGHAATMASFARLYFERGYSILMPDARGHGKSEGRTICMGWRERLDIVDWANYLVREHAPEEILLTGVSMGGATVMNASGEDLPECVHGVIDDCGFVSIRDEFIYQIHTFYHLPAYLFLIPASLLCRAVAGYSLLGDGDTCRQLQKSRLPMLFIHGGADNFVPTEHGRRAFAAASEPKRLVIVEKAGHALSYSTDPELYQAAVDRFLKEIHARRA